MTTQALPDLHQADYINDGKGLKSWLLTTDHKRIALMYLWCIGGFFLVGVLFGLLIRLELLNPGEDFMSGALYNRVLTLHGVIMTFLFIIPRKTCT